MSEADRLRMLRLAVKVACPWCSEPVGAQCRGIDGKVMPLPHEQRQSDWYAAGRPGFTGP